MDFIKSILYYPFLHQPMWVWWMFFGVMCVILFLDLGILEKRSREITAKKSFLLFLIYAGITCLYAGWMGWHFSPQMAQNFLMGYIVEMGLSIDNVFVFGLVFSYLNIPKRLQHRVLFWGILGALILRGIVIVIGGEILDKYDFVLLFFGVFLLYSGVKAIFSDEPSINLKDNKLLPFFRHYLRLTNGLRGEHFFVREESHTEPGKKKWYGTPLFLALLLIEFGDIAFAIDSVPAVIAVSHETFAIYTSDVFAVLGLRALYFLIIAAMDKFRYLQPACSLLLITIGIKIFVNEFCFKINDVWSLVVTFSLIGGGIILSLMKKQ
ncbi:MAG: TerC/Alx family metal homeostasis membrane protein [Alphaproteobacteria bacterium]|nr:TerC/Alx family metal homeostasis membrane protein [Alphaproteobacteria bacterium]